MTDTTAPASVYDAVHAFSDVNIPPYFTGSMLLDPGASKLFYQAGDKTEMIDVLKPTESQLATLAAACEPASFGLAKEDVIDESYRKALKMDSSQFSTQFSPLSSGIMGDVQQALFDKQATENIKVELYKLNVYGPGSFFKPHVDTPRSEHMVGSLVIVLPTEHEGGTLLFRHGGHEFSFDSASAIARDGLSQAPFVAFYSDVEHEVSVVTSGYRVTLTYNLYLAPSITPDPCAPSDVFSPGLNEICKEFKESLSHLLNNPDFLPEGGLIGFGLTHKYPFSAHTNLSTLLDYLKGPDVAFAQVCEDLNLDFELKALYADEDVGLDDIWALLDKFLKYDGEQVENGLFYYFTNDYDCSSDRGYNAQVVFDVTKYKSFRDYPDSQPIYWLKPPTGKNQFETAYIAYGNEASLDYAYGDLCLVAWVLGKERVQDS